jgi:hypothetical protein
MLNDLIKILADEPEKIEAAVLRGIKMLLNVLLGVWLYKTMIGPFYLFALSDYNEWGDYLLSGRVLVCLLFYFISDYFIMPFLSLPGYGLGLLFSKINGINKKSDVWILLKVFGIVKFQPDEKVPLPGPNIDILLSVSKAFETEEARSEVDSLKKTFISNVLNLYAAFIFIYFLLFDPILRTSVMSMIVIAVLLLVSGMYAFIHGLIAYMNKNYEEILNSLSFIKINALITRTLGSYRIFLAKAPKGEGIGKCHVFQRGAKEYVLCPPLTDRRLFRGDDELDDLINSKKKTDRVFIVIAEQGIFSDTQAIQSKYQKKLILIEYSSEDDLRIKLRSTIEELPF